MRVTRFDRSAIKNTVKTKDGFIKTDAVVTRTGIFIYHNEDGTIRRELRDHREVFNADSLETLKMIPLTNDHPPTETKLLTPENAKQYQVGFTGENVRADGENVRIPISITDASAIHEVESGKRGLSLGYECDLVNESGEYEGVRYDCKQTNIRYNHLAIVNSPRAGENARINLDSADIDDVQTTKSQKEAVMPKVRIDNIEYDAAQEVINFLSKETARADSAESATKSEIAAHDKTKAERDTLKARVDALETELKKVPELVAAGVKARIELERKAAVVLDEKDRDVSALSDEDVKKKIVLAVFPDAKLDGVSADYLNARVDSAIEAFDKIKRDTAMASQRQASAPRSDSSGQEEASVEAAEKRYRDRIREAYKTDGDGCGSKSVEKKDTGSIRK